MEATSTAKVSGSLRTDRPPKQDWTGLPIRTRPTLVYHTLVSIVPSSHERTPQPHKAGFWLASGQSSTIVNNDTTQGRLLASVRHGLGDSSSMCSITFMTYPLKARGRNPIKKIGTSPDRATYSYGGDDVQDMVKAKSLGLP